MNQWLYEDKIYEPPEEMDPKEIYGFVYLIENLKNGRKYIGKKLFWSMKSKQVKGLEEISRFIWRTNRRPREIRQRKL
jgi:hypothetical protein